MQHSECTSKTVLSLHNDLIIGWLAERMNKSGSSDHKVTEPLNLSKGEESIIFFFLQRWQGSTRRQTVRSEMQYFESFSNDKYHQQAQIVHSKAPQLLYDRGKREGEWRNKETCGSSEVSSNLGGHSIVFCPKGSARIFSKPCRHEYNHDNFIKSWFEITSGILGLISRSQFGDFKDTATTVLKGFGLSAALGKVSTNYNWQRCCLENRGRNKPTRMWIL